MPTSLQSLFRGRHRSLHSFQRKHLRLVSVFKSRGHGTRFHALPVGQQLRGSQMSNSVVLITGALTGIGRAAAVAFARKGAKVVVAGRRDEAGQALVKELRAFGSEAEFIKADVRQEDDVRNMVDKTVARFGRLDVAVNNAATEGAVGPITDQTAESFAATFETNVLGVVLSMKHEVRAMLTRFTGTAENKTALVTQVPLGRLVLSEEVADGIVFLGSDEGRFITGHVLNVDGGHSAN